MRFSRCRTVVRGRGRPSAAPSGPAGRREHRRAAPMPPRPAARPAGQPPRPAAPAAAAREYRTQLSAEAKAEPGATTSRCAAARSMPAKATKHPKTPSRRPPPAPRACACSPLHRLTAYVCAPLPAFAAQVIDSAIVEPASSRPAGSASPAAYVGVGAPVSCAAAAEDRRAARRALSAWPPPNGTSHVRS